MPRLATRLTERLGIAHPILSAPMDLAAGGKLCAAVSAAGGLGLLGGGYGEAEWLEREFAAAGNQRVGCGFITWSLATKPDLLDRALERRPAAIMLSFGDPRPFAETIRAAGALLICQVQNLAHAREAVEAGAEIVVAQGAEAGGHGISRGAISLIPEIAELLGRESPDTILVAAGGIANGAGLAAALMLGAEGVLMGSRFWATKEALAHPHQVRAALAATGDATVRQIAGDVARGREWPPPFTGRVLRTDFVERWHGREMEQRAVTGEVDVEAFYAALKAGDVANATFPLGEAAGLIHDLPSAGDLVERTVAEAVEHLRRGAARIA